VKEVKDRGLDYLVGASFGRWKVERYAETVTYRYPDRRGCQKNYWYCRCECGGLFKVDEPNLHNGKSNGCRQCADRDRWGKARAANIPSWVWHNILARCKTAGEECAVTPQYLFGVLKDQNWKCALTGVEIGFAPCNRLKNQTTASVDRIDSSKGYVEGNIWWVHKRINSMKNDYSVDEFVEWCKMVVEHSQQE
jgi:hypothetical protein